MQEIEYEYEYRPPRRTEYEKSGETSDCPMKSQQQPQDRS